MLSSIHPELRDKNVSHVNINRRIVGHWHLRKEWNRATPESQEEAPT
jgi:hypothetical protein